MLILYNATSLFVIFLMMNIKASLKIIFYNNNKYRMFVSPSSNISGASLKNKCDETHIRLSPNKIRTLYSLNPKQKR